MGRASSLDPYATSRRWALSGLAVLAILVAGIALTQGAVGLEVSQVVAVLGSKVGIGNGSSQQAEAVVWGIRMPRLLEGFAVGAAVAAVGAALQGMLRNQLADPHLLGIGPGAAIGAAIGSAAAGTQGAISGGVLAGVLTALAVRRLARRASIDQNKLILSGVALGAALSAWVGFVVFAADRSVVPPIEFWLLGSLAGSTWRALGTAVVVLGIATAGLLLAARTLDVMALGDMEARHLGIDTDLVVTVLLIISGVVIGAAVGVAGVVVFVGLLVPFLARRAVGPSHRHLLPACLLAGAVFLGAADLVARLALEPVEIPVGLVTAAVGGPLFVWMLSRKRDA